MSNQPIELNKKCQHFEINLEEQSELSMSELLPICQKKIPAEARHGDILYTQKFMKSLDAFFVNCVYDENLHKYEKTLAQSDLIGSGCCTVPSEVTAKITDPIGFYLHAFKFGDYDDVDFMGIEIDPEAHAELVKQYTNGRLVHKQHKCVYFHETNEWGDVGLYLLIADDNGAPKFVRLTPDVSDALLSELTLPNKSFNE